MDKLIIFNLILIGIIVGFLILFKKICKSDKSKYFVILFASLTTILCHYSSLPFHYFTDGKAFEFLKA